MNSARIIPWPRPVPDREPHPPVPTSSEASLERERKRRRLWIGEAKVIAISYAVNACCLGLFAITGTVPWWAAVLYAVAGWTFTGIACLLIASGRSAAMKDPSLSPAQTAVGMLMSVGWAAAFPQVGFLFLLTLFTIFLSATYRLSKKEINVAWLLVSLVFAAAVLSGERTFQIPHATWLEQLFVWVCLAMALARCVLLSIINTGHNKLMRQRGQQMAETLEKIERLANYDELTAALNRRSLMRILGEEIQRAERTGEAFSVALFDLDRFKAINDTMGHLIGDRTLRRFADVMHANQRNTDRFGRYGGEEFLLLMPNTSTDEAAQAVERMRAGLATTDWTEVAPTLAVTFSAGLATWRTGETVEQLLGRADLGLYGAKDAGRNCLRAG